MQQPDSNALADAEQLAADGLHIGRRLEQNRLGVGYRLRPQQVDLLADERPGSDRIRRRRNCQLPRLYSLHQQLDPADHREAEPHDGTEHDQEAQHRDRHRGQGLVADQPRQPAEDRVKRDRQYRAPQEDRHEGADHFQRPIGKQSQQAQSDGDVERQGPQ